MTQTRRFFCALGLGAWVTLAGAWSDVPAEELQALDSGPVRVLAVLDGDTLEVADAHKRRWRIRLQGIDAPEMAQTRRERGTTCRTAVQPHAEAARQALVNKVRGRTVHIRTDGTRSYDRVVAYVLLDRREINLEMVTEGWAWSVSRHHASARVQQAYTRAQREARAARRGLWLDEETEAAPVHPTKWRVEKRHC